MSGLEKLTALGRLSARLGHLILRRELIGIDEHNNRYYKRLEEHPNEGGQIERRWMKTPTGEYDPQQLPPEWAHWLRKTRKVPPTTEEVARAAAARQRVQQRAEELAEEDARRRFQKESLGLRDQAAPTEPSMDRFVEQLTGREAYEGSRQDAANAEAPPSQEHSPSQKPANAEHFKPEGWTPGQR